MANEESQESWGFIYELTRYTRTLNEERRAVWNGFDVKRQHVKVAILSAIIATLMSMIPFAVVGPTGGVLVFIVAFATPFLLIEGRQSGNEQLRYWRVLYDKRTSHVGQFILCNRIIEPGELRTGIIRSSSVPVVAEHDSRGRKVVESFDDLFAEPVAA